VPNYDLGQSNTLPQHSFEVQWPLLDTAPGGVGDADPAQCVDYLLNSTIYGALGGNPMRSTICSRPAPHRPPATRLADLLPAMGFGMSPLLDSQEPCLQILDRWTTIFNTDLCWTGYSLYFDPLGPDTVTANGVTYLPDNTLEFALTDDDFMRADGDDPVILRRTRQSDAGNGSSRSRSAIGRTNIMSSRPANRTRGWSTSIWAEAAVGLQANEICEPSDRRGLRGAVPAAQGLRSQPVRVRAAAVLHVPAARARRAVSRIRSSDPSRFG
jgi:hypothetical protein